MLKHCQFFLFLLFFTCSFQILKAQSPPNKLFELVKKHKSNIDFKNEITDERNRNYFLYDNFYGGAGVGVGDFNNDGLQDIYFAGNLVSDKLYLNKGSFEFEDITDKAGIVDDGGWSSGVTVADVNSDGYVDIFISRELYDDKPHLRINRLYINNQDLTFTDRIEEYGLSDTIRTRHATFLDYDKDGDLDLFVLNQPPNPGNYSPYFQMVADGKLIVDKYKPLLYENNNGFFSNVSESVGVNNPGYCNAAVSADFNNDGWVDLYVTNDFEVPDFLYMNNGDGTFTNQAIDQMKHISYFGMGVDAADINNDGWLDIMILDMAFKGNYRSKANLGGMNTEKFMNFVKKGWHHQYMYNTLQLNNQNNSFSEVAQLAGIAVTDWSWCNLIADLDNDGHKDIFVTNGIMRDIRNRDGEVGLKKYINEKIVDHYNKNLNLDDVGIWEVMDYQKALSFYPSEKISNVTYKNNENLQFTDVSDNWGLDQKTYSGGASYADLDNDGDLDLIINNVNDEAFLYKNNSDLRPGANYLRIELYKNGKPVSFFGAKAELSIKGKIQYLELSNARGMYSSSENIFHFGLGAHKGKVNVAVTWPNSKVSNLEGIRPNQIVKLNYEDANNKSPAPKNSQKTIFHDITPKTGLKYKHLENPFDDFTKQTLIPHKLSKQGPTLAVGDINNDGLDDFYIGGSIGNIGQLFHQDKNGQFSLSQSMPWFADRFSEDVGATFFDADLDGDLDLYVVSGGNEFEENSVFYQDRLYVNNGNGILTKSQLSLPKILASGSVVRSCDYDGDGDFDLFVGGRSKPWKYPDSSPSYLLENVSLTKDAPIFNDITRNAAPGLIDAGMVTDAVWTDYDNDNDMDLIVVGHWMSVIIFENDAGQLVKTENQSLKQYSGWWNSIEKADIDNDGDEDYILGNYGLNNAYSTSQTQPFRINYGDIDNNGTYDIVLSYVEGSERYPTCSKDKLIQQFPTLKQKYVDYHSYAQASLQEIFGQAIIINAKQSEVSTFASYYLENLGDGKFKFIMLPVEAQLSSINDIIVFDFNNDGELDLLTGGNFHPVETSSPRNDASIGCLLLANGNGGFSYVHQLESGIYLPHDLRQLKLINSSDGKKVIAANNSNIIQVFELKR